MKNMIKNIFSLIVLLGIIGCTALNHETEILEPQDREIRVISLNQSDDLQKILESDDFQVIDSFEIGQRTYLRVSIASGSRSLIPITGEIPQFLRDQGIRTIEEQVYYKTFTEPSDPLYHTHQYAPQIVNAEPAWQQATGQGVIVAVVDSGVNGLHEDLNANMVNGWDFIGFPSQGLAPGIYGADQNRDDVGHGTHVAGIIAAEQNMLGISGLAPQASIMPIRALSNSQGSDFTIAQAITYAVDNGADVINLSLGGPGRSWVMTDALNYALENNVVVIAAMGNDSVATLNYPAYHPGVIPVGASDGLDKITDFSTRGSHVSISAPGKEIISAGHLSNSSYLRKSGTSMAAPLVSGLVALLIENNPGITPVQIKAILESTADDIEAPGFDSLSGFGRINAAQALLAPLPAINETASGQIHFTFTVNDEAYGNLDFTLLNQSGNQVLTTLKSDPDTGMARFPFLPTGSYQIHGVFNSVPFTIPNIEVVAGEISVVSHNIELTGKTITFQTFRNNNYGSSADTVMVIMDLNTEEQLGSNDDFDGTMFSSITLHDLTPGQTLIIGVWHYSETGTGYYSLYANEGSSTTQTTASGTASSAGGTGDDPLFLSLNTWFHRYLTAGKTDLYLFMVP